MDLDTQKVDHIARDYIQNGQGTIDITVAYASGSPLDETRVRHRAEGLRQMLAERGVKDTKTSFVAVNDAQRAGIAVMSWPSIAAAAPKGCTERIPGTYGAETIYEVRKYKMGCEMQASISKMIADPSDLRGRAGAMDEDSRRQGAVVEGYKSGKPNVKLQGMNASTIGGSQQ
jgi:type IV pilus biogenesis protein CpaD/CtpE